MPPIWHALRDRLYVDEFYGVTVIAFYAWWAKVADWLDRRVWGGIVAVVVSFFGRLGEVQSLLRHDNWVDGTFDKGCEELCDWRRTAGAGATGRVQTYFGCLRSAWWCWPRS